MSRNSISKDKLKIGDEILTKKLFSRISLSDKQEHIQLHGFVRAKLSNGAFVIQPIKSLRWIIRRIFTGTELLKIST